MLSTLIHGLTRLYQPKKFRRGVVSTKSENQHFGKQSSCRFQCSCISIPVSDMGTFQLVVDNSKEITRRTFLKNTNREDTKRLEACLGYANHHSHGLTMSQDWHVRYYKAPWKEGHCYFFVHSGIEYLFTPEGVGAEGFRCHWGR